MIIANLLQSGAKDWMFGHPIRDLLARVALIQWFPYNNANCHMVTVWTTHLNCQSHESGSENHVPPPWAR